MSLEQQISKGIMEAMKAKDTVRLSALRNAKKYIIEALDAALEKRELIKVAVLKNCIDDPREIASVIGERTHSAVVKVIGKKMIFYRPAKKNPKIKLPE